MAGTTIGPDSPCEVVTTKELQPMNYSQMSPAWAKVVAGAEGGLSVQVSVPCDETVVELAITVERDNDGDWRVFIPYPTVVGEITDELTYLSGPGDEVYEVCNGVLHLAAHRGMRQDPT